MSVYTYAVIIGKHPEAAHSMATTLNGWLEERNYMARFETAPKSPCAWAAINHLNYDDFEGFVKSLKSDVPYYDDDWQVMIRNEELEWYSTL